jgi:hypothetical protein
MSCGDIGSASSRPLDGANSVNLSPHRLHVAPLNHARHAASPLSGPWFITPLSEIKLRQAYKQVP